MIYKLYMNPERTNIKVIYDDKEKYSLISNKRIYFSMFFNGVSYDIRNHSFLKHKFILYKKGLSFITFEHRTFFNSNKKFSLSYKGIKKDFIFNESKTIVRTFFFKLRPKNNYYELTINEENELESIFVVMCYFLVNYISDIYADSD